MEITDRQRELCALWSKLLHAVPGLIRIPKPQVFWATDKFDPGKMEIQVFTAQEIREALIDGHPIMPAAIELANAAETFRREFADATWSPGSNGLANALRAFYGQQSLLLEEFRRVR